MAAPCAACVWSKGRLKIRESSSKSSLHQPGRPCRAPLVHVTGLISCLPLPVVPSPCAPERPADSRPPTICVVLVLPCRLPFDLARQTEAVRGTRAAPCSLLHQVVSDACLEVSGGLRGSVESVVTGKGTGARFRRVFVCPIRLLGLGFGFCFSL